MQNLLTDLTDSDSLKYTWIVKAIDFKDIQHLKVGGFFPL